MNIHNDDTVVSNQQSATCPHTHHRSFNINHRFWFWLISSAVNTRTSGSSSEGPSTARSIHVFVESSLSLWFRLKIYYNRIITHIYLYCTVVPTSNVLIHVNIFRVSVRRAVIRLLNAWQLWIVYRSKANAIVRTWIYMGDFPWILTYGDFTISTTLLPTAVQVGSASSVRSKHIYSNLLGYDINMHVRIVLQYCTKKVTVCTHVHVRSATGSRWIIYCSVHYKS